MNVFLGHIDATSLAYGVVIFIGLAIILIKYYLRMWLSITFDALVFVAVFAMHGGTQKGGFAAAIAALLAGIFFPLIVRIMRPR